MKIDISNVLAQTILPADRIEKESLDSAEANIAFIQNKFLEESKDYTKTDNWMKLKKHHENVHNGVKEYIEANQDSDKKDKLIDISTDLESNVVNVFKTLNIVKSQNCNSKEKDV